MKKIFLICTLFVFVNSFSQKTNDVKTTFSGFIESYYSYDFNENTTNLKLPFMYNYNRHNEFNINIGLLRTKIEYEKAYASIAFHSGTYVEDNYAIEKTQFINELYIGLYLDNSKKHAIEVGIMPSYIGFESATTSTNLTLTRSILAENSPYFMTGLKYNFKVSEQWNFVALLTNGWQRINKPQKNIIPSFGSQIVYKANPNSSLNWSTFIGKEWNGTDFRIRYFSNWFWDKKWDNHWRTILGLDYGLQKLSSANESLASWVSPVLIAQYTINPEWQTAFRTEFYQDTKKVVIASNDEFSTLGFSLNFDYLPNSKVKLRTEARYFNSKKKVFTKDSDFINSNFFLTTSLSFEF